MCDYCLEFFHTDCIGVDEQTAKTISSYKCCKCTRDNKDEPMYQEGMLNN